METIITFLVIICVLTCIIEIIPLLFLKNRWKWIRTSLLCNVITNPIMNTILAILAIYVTNLIVYAGIVIILEIAVIMFEAFIFHNVMDESMKKCMVISVIINICSFIVGALIIYAIDLADRSSGSPLALSLKINAQKLLT